MALSEKKKREYSAVELEVLGKIIDYAERMIYEDGRHEYVPLRQFAYAKTVVIDSEKEGRMEFRLSSTPVVVPNRASGYATPHSPVGRLCSVVRPGDVRSSSAWGNYRVVETRLFERFDGVHFEDNVRNFLKMAVDGEQGKGAVTDLRRAVQGKVKRNLPDPSPAPAASGAEAVVPVEPPSPAKPVPVEATLPVEPAIQLTALDVEDDRDIDILGFDESDEGVDPRLEPTQQDYFGLNEIFYVDRTREQDEIISRSPVGPMFVQGIAGSGKTSAALGRAKMLCDFDASGVYDEDEFRKIVGDDMDHWSGKFAGQFSQQGSVGFVRTGELIQYLKETCRRIGLPNLPVEEFQELRSRLRNHRKVERSRLPGTRWSGAKLSRQSHDDTTMAWLHTADRAVARYFARLLPTLVPSVQDITARFDDEHRQSVSRIAEVAVERVREEISAVVISLASAKSDASFALDGLAQKIFQAIQRVRRQVLDREVLWFTTTKLSLIAGSEREMAGLLMAHKVPLFTRSTARLVFTGSDGLADRSLTLLDDSGKVIDYGDECRELQGKGKLLVRDKMGQTFVALLIDEDELYLRLLPESVDKPFVLSDGKLRPISLIRGKGRQKFKIVSQDAGSTDEEAELEEAVENPPGQSAEPAEPLKSVDGVVTRLLRQGLLLPLTYLADAYADALAADSGRFPDSALARVIAAQLAERKLTDEDIDLLLCLAHLIGRGFSQQPRWLSEPGYYQAVFVDEVQDFTEQQVFLMAEQAKPEYRAVTVVGDLAQKLHHGSQIDLPACFPGRSVPLVQLTENLRQLETPRLAWFSTCLRAEFHRDVRADAPSLEIVKRLEDPMAASNGPEWVTVPDEEKLGEVIIESLLRVPSNQSAVVIFPSAELAETWYQRLGAAMKERLIDAELSNKVDLARRYVRHFTSVANAKGLEFDVVLMPMVDSYDLLDQQQINRLYVGVTRARRRLYLIHQCALPARLLKVRERYLETLSAPEESVID